MNRRRHLQTFGRKGNPRLSALAVGAFGSRKLLWGSLTALFTFFPSTEALAFCRQNSCEDGVRRTCTNFEDPDDCTEIEILCERDEHQCIDEGHTLYRDSGCMSFAVARGNTKPLNLTDQDLLDIVTAAFARWQSVDCGGGEQPGFRIPSLGLVDARGAFYCQDPKLNVNTWLLAKEWTHDEKALGFTFSTSRATDGLVHDADVELNLGKIRLDFVQNDWRAVLLSIATHEAGHFLGLAHSLNPDAVMFAAYNRKDLHLRELQQDDVDGICAIFPPDPNLTCDAPKLIAAGLNPDACGAALDVGDNSNEYITSDNGGDDVPDDALGEPIARRGCMVSSHATGGVVSARWTLGLLLGAAVLRRRRW